MRLQDVLAAADLRADGAARTMAAATGGASLCSVSRTGEQIPGVKYPEGRWAAMRELARRLRALPQAEGPTEQLGLVGAVLAEVRGAWQVDLEARRAAGNTNWATYRLGGVDALDEIGDLLGEIGSDT